LVQHEAAAGAGSRQASHPSLQQVSHAASQHASSQQSETQQAAVAQHAPPAQQSAPLQQSQQADWAPPIEAAKRTELRKSMNVMGNSPDLMCME
jgi:hypothetical protein